MRGRTTTVRSWTAWPRLLLLAVMAVGVVQMHVSGHVGAEHGMPAEAPAAAHAMAPEPALPDSSAGGGTDHNPPAGGSELSLDALAVCLAILAAAGLAATALVALLSRPTPPSLSRGSGPLARRWSGRDPPLPVPPVGRQLASLSVLRI